MPLSNHSGSSSNNRDDGFDYGGGFGALSVSTGKHSFLDGSFVTARTSQTTIQNDSNVIGGVTGNIIGGAVNETGGGGKTRNKVSSVMCGMKQARTQQKKFSCDELDDGGSIFSQDSFLGLLPNDSGTNFFPSNLNVSSCKTFKAPKSTTTSSTRSASPDNFGFSSSLARHSDPGISSDDFQYSDFDHPQPFAKSLRACTPFKKKKDDNYDDMAMKLSTTTPTPTFNTSFVVDNTDFPQIIFANDTVNQTPIESDFGWGNENQFKNVEFRPTALDTNVALFEITDTVTSTTSSRQSKKVESSPRRKPIKAIQPPMVRARTPSPPQKDLSKMNRSASRSSNRSNCRNREPQNLKYEEKFLDTLANALSPNFKEFSEMADKVLDEDGEGNIPEVIVVNPSDELHDSVSEFDMDGASEQGRHYDEEKSSVGKGNAGEVEKVDKNYESTVARKMKKVDERSSSWKLREEMQRSDNRISFSPSGANSDINQTLGAKPPGNSPDRNYDNRSFSFGRAGKSALAITKTFEDFGIDDKAYSMPTETKHKEDKYYSNHSTNDAMSQSKDDYGPVFKARKNDDSDIGSSHIKYIRRDSPVRSVRSYGSQASPKSSSGGSAVSNKKKRNLRSSKYREMPGYPYNIQMDDLPQEEQTPDLGLATSKIKYGMKDGVNSLSSGKTQSWSNKSDRDRNALSEKGELRTSPRAVLDYDYQDL